MDWALPLGLFIDGLGAFRLVMDNKVEIHMSRIFLVFSALIFLVVGCAGDDAKEEAEVKKYKDQPIQRDGDRLNPRRD